MDWSDLNLEGMDEQTAIFYYNLLHVCRRQPSAKRIEEDEKKQKKKRSVD